MITIYYTSWDGKHGSRDLLRRAAADWCSRNIPRLETQDKGPAGEKAAGAGALENKAHPAPRVEDGGKAAEWRPEEFIIEQADSRSKPRFLYPEGAEFSVTHTGNLWMCAFSHDPVGLDAEQERECPRRKLSHRFFCPEEDAWLARKGDRGFFQVWTAKESYLKYTGEGLGRGMDSFCTVDEGGLRGSVEEVFQIHADFRAEDGQFLAVCVSSCAEGEILEWKSLE